MALNNLAVIFFFCFLNFKYCFEKRCILGNLGLREQQCEGIVVRMVMFSEVKLESWSQAACCLRTLWL